MRPGADSPSFRPKEIAMSSATAPIEFDDSVEDEHDRVLRWRCEELRRAGYDLKNAILLAVNPEVDLKLALELPARGCPHETALRILVLADHHGAPRYRYAQIDIEPNGRRTDLAHAILCDERRRPPRHPQRTPTRPRQTEVALRWRRDREPDPCHGPRGTPEGLGSRSSCRQSVGGASRRQLNSVYSR